VLILKTKTLTVRRRNNFVWAGDIVDEKLPAIGLGLVTYEP
jgi:hypothetical protein